MSVDPNNEKSPTTPPSGDSGTVHEPNTLSLKVVALFVIILLALIVGAQPVVAWLLRSQGGKASVSIPLTSFDPGSARAWNHPEADLAALRKEENKHLAEYAWIDRKHGVVRIPITRAMKLLVERGRAKQPEGTGPPPHGTTKGSTDEHH